MTDDESKGHVLTCSFYLDPDKSYDKCGRPAAYRYCGSRSGKVFGRCAEHVDALSPDVPREPINPALTCDMPITEDRNGFLMQVDRCGLPAAYRYGWESAAKREWSGRCAGHVGALSPQVHREPLGVPVEVRRTMHVPAEDIEQVVADAESKREAGLDADHDVLGDLMLRLRTLAGLDVSGYTLGCEMAMTIGRTDECLIVTPHDVSFCGKPAAHQ